MSEETKHLKRAMMFAHIMSWLVSYVPICVFIVIGFINGTEASKVALGITTISAILIAVVGLIQRLHLRSTLWVVLLGLCFVINNTTQIIAVMTVCTVADELIIYPIYQYYKNRYVINREIDRRQP